MPDLSLIDRAKGLSRRRSAYKMAADPDQAISSMQVFQDLSDDQVEALMDSMPTDEIAKGTVIYGNGKDPEVLFFLESGKIELYRESPWGRRLTLAIIEPGSFFGEMSLIGQRLVGTCAVALDDSEVCALSREDVRTLVTHHPEVGLRLIEALAERLQQTRDSLENIAFNDVTGRVANLLLQMADDDDVVKGYSHQELASMVGCLRESFTSTLDKFKASDAVQVGRKRIEIVDRSQIEEIVGQRSGTNLRQNG